MYDNIEEGEGFPVINYLSTVLFVSLYVGNNNWYFMNCSDELYNDSTGNGNNTF